MTTWIQQRNGTDKSDLCTISVRKMGFGINAIFYRLADLDKYLFASIFLSEDKSKIAIEFHEEKKEGCYYIGSDGGGKSRVRLKSNKNRFIACGNVIRSNPVLNQLSKTTGSQKLVVSKEDGYWVARITPAFIYEIGVDNPKDDEIGVYRYLLNDEIVYIGKGQIKKRVSSPERKEWEFEKIQYSVLKTDDDCVIYESNLLNEHVKLFGSLPKYNRILGVKI